jgi:hypothetical protein
MEASLQGYALSSDETSLLKFVRIPSNDGQMIQWPCLEFDSLKQLQDFLTQKGVYPKFRKTIYDNSMSQMRQQVTILQGKVAYLLGKETPNRKRIHLFDRQETLKDFYGNCYVYIADYGDNTGYFEAMGEASPQDDSPTTATTGSPDSTKVLGAPKGSVAQDTVKRTEGNDELAKKIATDTTASSDKAKDSSVAGVPDSQRAAAVMPEKSMPATALPPPGKDVQMKETEVTSAASGPPNGTASASTNAMDDPPPTDKDVEMQDTDDPKESLESEEANINASGTAPTIEKVDEVSPPHKDVQMKETEVTSVTRGPSNVTTSASEKGKDDSPTDKDVEMKDTEEARESLESEEANGNASRLNGTAPASEKADDVSPQDTDVQTNDTEAADIDPEEDDLHSTQQDHSPHKATASSTDITPTRNKTKSTEVHEQLALLQFEDVKETLKVAGFVFKKTRYYRPGMDPKQNKSAVLGQDYFTTEQAFRENLCAYGLEDCDKWTEDNRYEVNTWVRYSIAGSHRDRTHIPVLSDIPNGAKAWSTLKLVGFFHLYQSLGENWCFPGEKDAILGTTKFDNEKEFYDRLIRFGFPETCTFDRITDNERIMLESYLADKGRLLTL